MTEAKVFGPGDNWPTMMSLKRSINYHKSKNDARYEPAIEKHTIWYNAEMKDALTNKAA